jgi:hypothetical protein
MILVHAAMIRDLENGIMHWAADQNAPFVHVYPTVTVCTPLRTYHYCKVVTVDLPPPRQDKIA